MGRLLTLPLFTAIFVAPIGLAVMMIWPAMRGTGSIVVEPADLSAMAFLTLGLSGVAATLAMGHAPKSRRLR